MGLFNKILKGLGFEDEDIEEEKPQKIKEKKEKKNNNITAEFNLDNYKEEQVDVEQEKPKVEQNNNEENNLNFEVLKVKSQIDVQNAAKKLKLGAKLLINIEGLNDADIIRSLDFITGAVFALDLKMQKIDEKIYLIQ